MKLFHAKRLLRLVKKLREVSRERKKFDMSHWFHSDLCNLKGKEFCGATACAFGWACSIPEFKRAGLRMVTFSNGNDGSPTFFPRYKRDYGYLLAANQRIPAETAGFMAAEAFFGLSWKESHKLFHDDWYPGVNVTPSMVIKRILNLVKLYHPQLVSKKAVPA